MGHSSWSWGPATRVAARAMEGLSILAFCPVNLLFYSFDLSARCLMLLCASFDLKVL